MAKKHAASTTSFARRRRTRRWPRGAVVLLGGTALLVGAASDRMADGTDPGAALARPATQVRVIDGDTLAFGRQRIRLDGIASPEEAHPVYGPAKQHLEALLRAADSVACRVKTHRDRYGRVIGRCEAVRADGTRLDLQGAMVEAGFARACPGWGTYAYLLHENADSLSLPFPSYCWPG